MRSSGAFRRSGTFGNAGAEPVRAGRAGSISGVRARQTLRAMDEGQKSNYAGEIMDTIEGTNPTGLENDTRPLGHKSNLSPARLAANRRNAKLAGRPKGSGVKLVDRRSVERLVMTGASVEEMARRLGVSRRTLKRRMVEWRESESTF